MNISSRLRGAASGNIPPQPSTPPPPVPIEKDKELLPTAEDGVLNIDVAEKLLAWHAEAVGRCVELSIPSDL